MDKDYTPGTFQQDHQVNPSHTERLRYDDTDDGESWFEEETYHYHHGEASHQNAKMSQLEDEDEDQSDAYQDAQDPNEDDDSNAEDKDEIVTSFRLSRTFFHDM